MLLIVTISAMQIRFNEFTRDESVALFFDLAFQAQCVGGSDCKLKRWFTNDRKIGRWLHM